MATDSALDALVQMVQVIQSDRQLLEWFSILARKPTMDRRDEIFLVSQRMIAEGEDEAMAVCVRLLVDPRIFEATRFGAPWIMTPAWDAWINRRPI